MGILRFRQPIIILLHLLIFLTMVGAFVNQVGLQRCTSLGRSKVHRWTASMSHIHEERTPPRRIVFLGTPQVAAQTLNALHKAAQASSNGPSLTPFEIIRVVSQPPALIGRKQVLTPSPVQTLATTLNIPTMTPESAKNEEFLSELENLNIDLFITAAYGNYLPKRFLQIPKFGTINIHPSLLPKYRGAAPVQRCLEQGDAITGVSVLYSVAKMDAGPIISQVQYPLNGDETATKVLDDCFQIGVDSLIESLPTIFAKEIQSREQDHQLATSAPKVESSEGLIDFGSFTARQVHNKARAFSEWPGIFGYFSIINKANIGTNHVEPTDVQRIKILKTKVVTDLSSPTNQDSQIVKVSKFDGKDILEVTCKDGSKLAILELQPAGKKPMNVKAFANGLHDRVMKWVTPLNISPTR